MWNFAWLLHSFKFLYDDFFIALERESGEGEDGHLGSESGDKEQSSSPNASADENKLDSNKHKRHLVNKTLCDLVKKIYPLTLIIYN